MIDERVKLGVTGRDKITGFQGIVVTQLICLFGCSQWGLAGTTYDPKEQKRAPTEYFDEGRVEYVDAGIHPKEVQAERPGCDFNADRP